MQELDDITLLRQYTEQNSEEAFAVLVSRHVNKVYSVALRHTCDPHQAEEITQAVFVILARKANKLCQHTALSGWLHETSRLTAVALIRSEIRRARREQEAHMQNLLKETESDVWPQIAPLLDAAMAGLNETDRHAVVLRFFDGKSMREVGAALGASEDAAKMRLNRAVEKLRGFFIKHGIVLPAAVLTAAMSANSVQAAPAVLAKTAVAVALANGATASGSTLTLIKGALKIMAWTKAKTAIVATVGVMLAAGMTTVAVTKVRQQKTSAGQEKTYAWQVPNPNLSILNETPPQVAILPTKFSKAGNSVLDGERVIGIGASIAELIGVAYDNTWTPARTILPPNLPQQRFDFIANLPTGSRKALLKEMENQFHITGRSETREVNVMFLTARRPNAGGLRPSSGHGLSFGGGHYDAKGQTMGRFTKDLESYFSVPIVDQTGLPGSYDFNLRWIASGQPASNNANLKQALLDQLGLELVSNKMPIEMLVVEKEN